MPTERATLREMETHINGGAIARLEDEQQSFVLECPVCDGFSSFRVPALQIIHIVGRDVIYWATCDRGNHQFEIDPEVAQGNKLVYGATLGIRQGLSLIG